MTDRILTWPVLRVDLAALRRNYRFLCNLVAPAKCAAVVKNNAYGLGVVPVVEALRAEGCQAFWVAHAHEGAEIRGLLPTEEIIVLQGPGEDTIELFGKYALTPVINTLSQLAFWEKEQPKNARCFVLHLDSGLNRYGLREEEIHALVAQPERLANLSMIMSHLACADSIGHFMNDYQQRKFAKYQRLFPGVPATLSASDGAFLGPAFFYDMIRAGAALYGINTAPYRENQMQSVVYVEAPVLQVAKLPMGQYAGYGATYRANMERKLAVISIGYGDGLSCQLQNRGKIYFKTAGKRYESRIIGRVSMDITLCDITDIPEGMVKVGTMATILDEHYTLDDMARDSSTIGYEILSRLGTRYQKIYR